MQRQDHSPRRAGEEEAPPARWEAIERLLSSRACLAAVLVAAAGLRLGHVLAIRALPSFQRLVIDSEIYDAWAQRIAGGDWLTRVLGGPFYMDPLYPYFLAAVYRTIGRDLLVVRLLQAAMGVATCWVAARIAARIRGPLAGNVAAALLALSAPSIFEEGELEKTALGVLLAAAALAWFLRDSWRSHAASGAALALAALTRGNILLLAPPAIVWLAATGRRRSAVAFAAAAALVILPVTLRNRAVSGEWVLTTSGAGQNFYTGNNPANPDGAYHSVPFARPQAAHEEGDFRAEAERRLGRRVTASESSSFWFRQTLAHVAAHPAFAARVLARKAALFFSDVDLADAWGMAFVAGFSPVLRGPLVPFAALLGLAVLGAGPAARRREGRVVLAYVALYSASVVAFFVFSRYRLHVVPALAALGGVGVASLADDVRRARWRAALPPVAAAVLVAAASAAAFPERRQPPIGNYAMLAEMYQERGELDAARRVLDEGLARAPGAAAILCARAKLDLRAGAPAGALQFVSRCLDANPAFPDGWYLLGLAWEANGDPSRAEAAYRRQLELVPGHELARRRVAAVR